ncbi:MAG: hypothetical protein ACKVKP_03380 [Acidimicrobiales bacterium]|jgi:hypothetical protein
MRRVLAVLAVAIFAGKRTATEAVSQTKHVAIEALAKLFVARIGRSSGFGPT